MPFKKQMEPFLHSPLEMLLKIIQSNFEKCLLLPWKWFGYIYRGCEKSDISKHLLIHEAPKHYCDFCSKSFRHFKNKELHMKR